MISLEKWQILTPLQNLPKNVADLGELIVAKGFKSFPKSNKLPNLVTLITVAPRYTFDQKQQHFVEKPFDTLRYLQTTV